MDNNNNNISNATLNSILEQLKNLNSNLSTGNLLGDKNRLYRQNFNQFGSFKEQIESLKGDVAKHKSEQEKRRSKIAEHEKTLADETATDEKKRGAKSARTKHQNVLDEEIRMEKNSIKEIQRLRLNAAYSVAPAIKQAVSSISNIIFTVLETNIKKQGIRLQAASELQTRAIQTYGKALNNAIGVQVGNVTGTVLDTAYQSLNAVMEGGRSIYMKSLSDAITYRQKENELYKANAEATWGVVDEVGGALSAIPGKIGLLGNAISMIASVGKRRAMVIAAQTELEIKQDEEVRKNQDEWLQQIEGVVKQFADMSKQITKSFLEAGNSAYAYGRTLGLGSGALRNFHDTLIESVNVDLAQLGMDFNDYFKMQESYNEATGGRAGILGNQEAMLVGGLSKRLGIGAEQVSTIVGGMNVFNTSIADGSQMIYKMANTASKMGLSATRFAKDLEKNLKLAEKYQFRGGVKGMMEMALWAQRTRFNIDSISSLQEKMLGGNIEDIIQTSARLNVLGGRAAMYSDPLGMMFDAMDPARMAQRVNNMIQGYGTFNAKTGETEFNRVEMMRMNQMAEAMGMSREELMNQARQAGKTAQIERQYGRKFDEKTLTGLTQHATWSEEKQDWIIKVNAPGTEKGFEERSLSELSPNDKTILENIFPEDKQDRLLDYVKNISDYFSVGEQQAAYEKGSIGKTMAKASEKGLWESQKELAELRREYTERNADKDAKMVMDFSKAAVLAQTKMNDFVARGGAGSVVESYLAFTQAQNDELLEKTDEFVASGKTIEGYLDEIRMNILGIDGSLKDENGKFKKNWNVEKGQMHNEKQGVDIKDLVYNKTSFNGQKLDLNREDHKRFADNLYEKVMSGEFVFENGKYYQISKKGNILNNLGFTYSEPAKQAQDAIITPRGPVYTHPDDLIAAFKPDGPIMKAMTSYMTPRESNTRGTNTFYRNILGKMSLMDNTLSGINMPFKFPVQYDKEAKFDGFDGFRDSVFDMVSSRYGINQFSTKDLMRVAKIYFDNINDNPQIKQATPITPRTINNVVEPRLSGNRRERGEVSTSQMASKIEVSGTLKLDTGTQNVDLMGLINNNPESIRRITEEVIVAASSNMYGGRSVHAPNRFTV